MRIGSTGPYIAARAMALAGTTTDPAAIRARIADVVANLPPELALSDIRGWSAWGQCLRQGFAPRGLSRVGHPRPQPDRAALKPILEDPNVEKINHNIKYELSVLRRNGIDLQGIAGDPAQLVEAALHGVAVALGSPLLDIGDQLVLHARVDLQDRVLAAER